MEQCIVGDFGRCIFFRPWHGGCARFCRAPQGPGQTHSSQGKLQLYSQQRDLLLTASASFLPPCFSVAALQLSEPAVTAKCPCLALPFAAASSTAFFTSDGLMPSLQLSSQRGLRYPGSSSSLSSQYSLPWPSRASSGQPTILRKKLRQIQRGSLFHALAVRIAVALAFKLTPAGYHVQRRFAVPTRRSDAATSELCTTFEQQAGVPSQDILCRSTSCHGKR